jgi:D-beta-D-heptose 7-phosphate kinase/D-beta-D-heptose 1-phosphate adenosyltransferase
MAGMGISKLKNEFDFENLGRAILKKLRCRSVLITRGEAGMTLFEKNKIMHIPTAAKEVFDVTGAGDTVIAVLTLALSCGASLMEAAKIANYAAGIVVGKLGTATVLPSELSKSLK